MINSSKILTILGIIIVGASILLLFGSYNPQNQPQAKGPLNFYPRNLRSGKCQAAVDCYHYAVDNKLDPVKTCGEEAMKSMRNGCLVELYDNEISDNPKKCPVLDCAAPPSGFAYAPREQRTQEESGKPCYYTCPSLVPNTSKDRIIIDDEARGRDENGNPPPPNEYSLPYNVRNNPNKIYADILDENPPYRPCTGPRPMAPARLCADGSFAGNATCVNGEWKITTKCPEDNTSDKNELYAGPYDLDLSNKDEYYDWRNDPFLLKEEGAISAGENQLGDWSNIFGVINDMLNSDNINGLPDSLMPLKSPVKPLPLPTNPSSCSAGKTPITICVDTRSGDSGNGGDAINTGRDGGGIGTISPVERLGVE